MSTPYSPQDATTKIRKILQAGGSPEPTWHCRNESMPERDVDDLDISTLLAKTGSVISQPVWNEEHQNHVYKVKGKDAIGDDLTAVVVIDELAKEIVVITVF